jgi:hypothetical protein
VLLCSWLVLPQQSSLREAPSVLTAL